MESKTGYSENGLPYFRLGDASRNLVVFDGLNFENKPPSGLQLRWVAGDFKEFAKVYTVYSVGRKPSLPQGYTTRDMATDYAEMIRNELDHPRGRFGAFYWGNYCPVFCFGPS